MYLSALVIGFLGSLHCLGMCGPIALAIPVPRRKKTIAFALVPHRTHFDVRPTWAHIWAFWIFCGCRRLSASAHHQHRRVSFADDLSAEPFQPLSCQILQYQMDAMGATHHRAAVSAKDLYCYLHRWRTQRAITLRTYLHGHWRHIGYRKLFARRSIHDRFWSRHIARFGRILARAFPCQNQIHHMAQQNHSRGGCCPRTSFYLSRSGLLHPASRSIFGCHRL